jgi:hypothetical protein
VDSILAAEYRNPDLKKDVLAKRAAFNSQYSTDMEAILKNSFGLRYQEGTKLDLYKSLIKNGYGFLADRGEAPPTASFPNEQMRQFPIRDWPEYDPEKKRVVRSEKVLYVPASIYSELDQVVNASLRPESNKLFGALTQLQLAAPTDAIVHGKNLLAAVTTALGRDSAYKDVINKIPILNSVNAIREIRSVIKEIQEDGKKIRGEKAEIAKMAGIRPHYDKEGLLPIPFQATA